MRRTPVYLALAAATVACTDVAPTTAPNSSPNLAKTGAIGVRGTLIYGITADNELITFASEQPNKVLSRVSVRGLAGGERIVGIDFRPSAVAPASPAAIGRLYAVSSASRVYTVDPATGTLGSPVTLSIRLTGTVFGVGFNPAADRLRVHSDADQNLRINVDNGVTIADTTLAYPATGANPRIAGTAYTNNDNDPSTGTTLYAIDAALDALTVFNIPSGPNSGKMTVVGSLGVETDDNVGFDIAGSSNLAYATLGTSASGKATLYAVDLATGAATRLGLLAQTKSPVVGIAVAP